MAAPVAILLVVKIQHDGYNSALFLVSHSTTLQLSRMFLRKLNRFDAFFLNICTVSLMPDML